LLFVCQASFLGRCARSFGLYARGTLYVGQGGELVLFQEIVYASKVFPYLSAAELVNLGYKAVEEIAVVAYYDCRSVESAYGLFQHVFRAHVEVVGRLVENQEVYRLEQQTYHGKTAAFSSREELYVFVACLAAEHECPEYVAYFKAYLSAGHAVDCVEHGYVVVEQLCLVLCVISYFDVVSYLEFPFERYLAHNALYER